jgi:hypothetical protein
VQQPSLGGLALRGARRSRTGTSNRWYLSEARALLDSSGRRLVADNGASVIFDSCEEAQAEMELKSRRGNGACSRTAVNLGRQVQGLPGESHAACLVFAHVALSPGRPPLEVPIPAPSHGVRLLTPSPHGLLRSNQPGPCRASGKTGYHSLVVCDQPAPALSRGAPRPGWIPTVAGPGSASCTHSMRPDHASSQAAGQAGAGTPQPECVDGMYCTAPTRVERTPTCAPQCF